MKDFNWIDFLIQKKRISIISGFVPPGCRLLDIGCGYYPENLLSLKDKVSSAVGIDREPPETSPSKNISFVKYDIEDKLPFQDGEFDCVTILAVLEHLKQPEEVIKESARVLRPGGVLIVTIPSSFSRPVLEALAFMRIISREEISGHLNYYSMDRLAEMIASSGYKIEVKKYYNLYMNIIAVSRKT